MILYDDHDSNIGGHFCIYKTLERLKHNYDWYRMEEDVKDYVQAYNISQHDKPSRHRQYGQLEPLVVPYPSLSTSSMDSIVVLPLANGYTWIWVVVDRFTKMAHLFPIPMKLSAKDIVKIL